MPEATDATPTEAFKQGILRHNHAMVDEALKKGASANTAVDGQHPLVALFRASYADLPEADRKTVAETQFDQSVQGIMRRLFDGGMKVAEEGKYDTGLLPYVADRFLINPDKQTVATIVIQAISETLKDGRAVYQPNLPNFVANFMIAHASEQTDFRKATEEIITHFEGVYSAVRERLADPKTQVERDVAAAGEKIAAWRGPMERPDLDGLLKQIGMSAGRYRQAGPGAEQEADGAPLEAEGQVSFSVKPFLTEIEKKEPSAVLLELKQLLVGHKDLQMDLKRLALRQSFEAARQARGIGEAESENYSTAFTGSDGVGKGIYVQKYVELLVALGLAGRSNFSITEENLARVAGGTSPPQLAKIFAQADTIAIEVPPTPDAPGPNTPDLGKTFLIALQMSLQERKQQGRPDPVVFLSGKRDEIEALYDQVPALKTLVPTVKTMADLSDDDLGEVLKRKLKKNSYELDTDGQKLVVDELAAARKKFGNDFRNAKEVDVIVKRLPDAMAERLLGGEENEAALITPPSADDLTHATLADVKALNIPRLVGGLAQAQRRRTGF